MKLTRLLSSPTAFLTVAASVGVATVVTSAAPASAISNPITLNFVCAVAPTTATAISACNTGTTQFSALVSPVGSNQVKFSFANVGSGNSSITKLDFSDKAQYSIGSRSSVAAGPNSVVNVGNGTTTLGTINKYTYTALGVPSVQRDRGINQGESLDIILNIANAGFNKPFNAVVTDLFKKGLFVQLTGTGFGTGTSARSAQYVFNSKVKAVPEPITLLGSGAALGFGALMKRRSSKLKAKKAGNTPVEPTLEAVA
jgi:hypothetical protein